MPQDPIIKQACEAYPDQEKLRDLFQQLIKQWPNQYSNDEKGFQLFYGDIDQLVNL